MTDTAPDKNPLLHYYITTIHSYLGSPNSTLENSDKNGKEYRRIWGFAESLTVTMDFKITQPPMKTSRLSNQIEFLPYVFLPLKIVHF